MTLSLLKEIGAEGSFENNIITIQPLKATIADTIVVESDWSSASYFYRGEVIKGTDAFNGALDLANSPDIAQTIAVTCFGLGVSCHMTGLHTLKIKETDRLEALKIEIEKLGGSVAITDTDLKLEASKEIQQRVAIDTYQDHRMAMAFAPLALRTHLVINEAEVVSKSYPDFWKDMKQLGFQIQEK